MGFQQSLIKRIMHEVLCQQFKEVPKQKRRKLIINEKLSVFVFCSTERTKSRHVQAIEELSIYFRFSLSLSLSGSQKNERERDREKKEEKIVPAT